ncbi:MAG: hypothetical protein H7838_01530 [Magnetococcus sp. DMHC-8]
MVLLGGFEAMRVQTAKRKMEQTQEAMQEIQRALLGFITVNGFLPCAAANPALPALPSGQADCLLAPADGLLPWTTLGVKGVDPWGHHYRYHVAPAFTHVATFPGAVGDLLIRDLPDSRDVATQVALLVISLGANGQWDSRINATRYRIGSDDILWWIPTYILKYQ